MNFRQWYDFVVLVKNKTFREKLDNVMFFLTVSKKTKVAERTRKHQIANLMSKTHCQSLKIITLLSVFESFLFCLVYQSP